MGKKGENIYRRKDKRWEARYIKEYAADGSAHYGYCYGKTYSEAKQKQLAAQMAWAAGKQTAVPRSKQRLADFGDEWLQLNRTRIKEATFVKYTAVVEKYIKPRLGGYLLKNLSSVMVEQFSRKLLQEDRLAPKTVKDILMILHGIFKYINKQLPGALPPIDIVYPKDTKKEMRVLTAEEQKRLVRYLTNGNDPCQFGVLLALMTGMRIGEVCALRWRDISIEERTVAVTATMQRLKNLDGIGGAKTHIVISDPKSNTSARLIPLTAQMADLCKKYRSDNPDAFVLTGLSERYIEPRTMQYRLEQYTAACGLDGVHFHTLRHTFATRCVEVNFEIKSLSEILGHSTPRITLERYVHSSLELKRNNMDKLAAIGF